MLISLWYSRFDGASKEVNTLGDRKTVLRLIKFAWRSNGRQGGVCLGTSDLVTLDSQLEVRPKSRTFSSSTWVAARSMCPF
eukprot:2694898-Amphidinium_carterae.1